MSSEWLAALERTLAGGGHDELAIALVGLAAGAGLEVEVPEDERRAAGRRAALLLATGGDPARQLDLHGRAVTALAADLDTPPRRAAFEVGLAKLRVQAKGLPHVREALRQLLDAPEVAWRAFAASVLAEELDPEG